MNLISKSFVLTIFPLMIISFTDYLKTAPRTISGTVENAGTGAPVENALVYISKGNEEVLTTRSGNFSLKTWQDLPVKIIVEHPDFSTTTVLLDKNENAGKIRLYKK